MGFYWSHLFTWTLFENKGQDRYRPTFHFRWPSKRPPTVKFVDMNSDKVPEIWITIPGYVDSTRAIYKLQPSGAFARVFSIPTECGVQG